MPDPTLQTKLRGLILSAADLRTLSDWPGALIEDYLNILDNLTLIADEIDTKAGYAEPQSVTISGGIITLTGDYPFRLLTVDTEGAAATDDLDSISGGTVGERVILQSTDNARTVVVKDGTGFPMQADFSLNNTTDKIEFLMIADGIWHELSRRSSG